MVYFINLPNSFFNEKHTSLYKHIYSLLDTELIFMIGQMLGGIAKILALTVPIKEALKKMLPLTEPKMP